ncbi:MAG TPA: AMIN domain-containing protein, partial [Gammaproteobacteria bacterium]|nr:AMIN domain-containing protein [Gammaproteobacteria bacterium]
MNAILTNLKPATGTRRFLQRLIGTGMLLLAIFLLQNAWNSARADEPLPLNTLKEITFAGLPGNQVQITFRLSQPASNPASFTIDNPARIAFDLPATKSGLAKRSQTIGIGPAKSITAVEVKGRTRVVLNLFEMVPYETRSKGDEIIVVLGSVGAVNTAASPSAAPATSSAAASVTGIDFRRGDQGEGRIILTLSNPAMPVDMSQQSGKVILELKNAQLPEQLQRRLDVTDFATPVKIIDTESTADGVRMEISSIGKYDYLAYQSDNQFTVEIRKTTKEEQDQRKKEEFGYTGERLSLNFQDIEVRSVLQLLADFTGINIVV